MASSYLGRSADLTRNASSSSPRWGPLVLLGGDSVSPENRYLQDAFCYVVRSSAIVNADSQVNSTAHNETQGKVCPSVSEPRILLNAVMSLSAKEQVSEDGIIQTSQVSSLT